MLREKTLRQSEMAKLKIDKLEQNLDSMDSEKLMTSEVPDEIPLLKENEVQCAQRTECTENDDLEQLTLRLES